MVQAPGVPGELFSNRVTFVGISVWCEPSYSMYVFLTLQWQSKINFNFTWLQFHLSFCLHSRVWSEFGCWTHVSTVLSTLFIFCLVTVEFSKFLSEDSLISRLEEQSLTDWEVIQKNLKYELLTHLHCLSHFFASNTSVWTIYEASLKRGFSNCFVQWILNY